METLRERFSDVDLVYSIGGQISFDVFPKVGHSQEGGTAGRCVGVRAALSRGP